MESAAKRGQRRAKAAKSRPGMKAGSGNEIWSRRHEELPIKALQEQKKKKGGGGGGGNIDIFIFRLNLICVMDELPAL